MKTDTSSLDLHYIISELSFLVGGKVDKIYQEGKNMVLQFHVTSHGKQMVSVIAPKYFYLASKKPDFPQTPGGFCMFLRKYLENTRVKNIRQVGFERIVEIEFESKEEKYRMIIELFSKGNIILCKDDYTIMSALETKVMTKRTVRGGVKYDFPTKEYSIIDMSEDDLKKAVDESDKESIVKMLAMDLGIGGIYAEQICSEAEIDKGKKKLTESEIRKLHDVLKSIVKKKIEAIVTDKEEIFPFSTYATGKENKTFESFNSAIDYVVTPSVISGKKKEETSKHEKKIGKVKDIIRMQQKQAETFEKGYNENKRSGEIIYENYTLIKEVIDTLKKARKKHSWKEIKEKLKDHKVVKDINEKESKITIEIEDK